MSYCKAVLLSLLITALGQTNAFAEALKGETIVFPIMEAPVSSKYGSRKHPIYHTVKHHNGVDLAAPKRAHVRSIAKGRVVYAGVFGGYGKLVTIVHSGGYTSMYGHLSEILVNTTQTVEAGQIIGRVGSTGTSTSPHLHFEWRKEGEALNPLDVFPNLGKKAEG